MTTGETAALGLPRSLRSPWRWTTLAIGVVLMLVGVSGFAAAEGELAAVLVACAFAALGVLVIYLSWRSGVLVSQEYVQERGMTGKSERISWADITEVKVVPGESILPSKAVELVRKNAEESITLSSLSWYSLRPSKVPARVAEFMRIASVMTKC
jgi:hypothetical protein